MRPWPGENDRVTKGLGLRLQPAGQRRGRSKPARRPGADGGRAAVGPGGRGDLDRRGGRDRGRHRAAGQPARPDPDRARGLRRAGYRRVGRGAHRRLQHRVRDRDRAVVLLRGHAVGGRRTRRAPCRCIGSVVGHSAPAAGLGGARVRPLRRCSRSDTDRAHRGVATTTVAARARSSRKGVPVAECRRAAAGQRAHGGGRLVATAGVQGSVQCRRDPVGAAHVGVPGLARAARTDRQDVDGASRQGCRAGSDPRRVDGGVGHARGDRRAKPDGATGRGIRPQGR